ncbi:hypothetical protein JVT61DRAFT_8363 [Boletus reticuloceps]|uniref:Uncharacterized protein n=1 Tax=Boletus reticuloceps TaxID=495285 RepID=A0A8I2Z012_9AGAM|nr:hypothetical protein JVT61DRAFT_8363 [Boletus reticuloceps]
MPIPDFVYPVKRICSLLEARLFHHCLDIILEPLKQACWEHAFLFYAPRLLYCRYTRSVHAGLCTRPHITHYHGQLQAIRRSPSSRRSYS